MTTTTPHRTPASASPARTRPHLRLVPPAAPRRRPARLPLSLRVASVSVGVTVGALIAAAATVPFGGAGVTLSIAGAAGVVSAVALTRARAEVRRTRRDLRRALRASRGRDVYDEGLRAAA